MSWLPADFFIGNPGRPEARPQRPIGQGDVFTEVPVAGRTGTQNGQPALKAKPETVIVVASSCGMRKLAGGLNDVLHVAPVNRLASLAPEWSEPWEGHLHILPLPGLAEGTAQEMLGANLGRIGLCGTDTLDVHRRIGCASLDGMQALKMRVATYFARVVIPGPVFAVGASREWYELDLWERWVVRTGHDDGFQDWLEEPNPNYPGRTRRDTIYDDVVGIQQQLEATAT